MWQSWVFSKTTLQQLLSHSLSGTHTCSLCTQAHREREREEGVLLDHPDISRLSHSSPLCHPTENKKPLKSLQHQQKTKTQPRYRAGTSDTHQRAQAHNPKYTRAHAGREWLRYKSPVSFCHITNMYPHFPHAHELGHIYRKKTNKHSGSSVPLETHLHHGVKMLTPIYKNNKCGGTKKEAAIGLQVGAEFQI